MDGAPIRPPEIDASMIAARCDGFISIVLVEVIHDFRHRPSSEPEESPKRCCQKQDCDKVEDSEWLDFAALMRGILAMDAHETAFVFGVAVTGGDGFHWSSGLLVFAACHSAIPTGITTKSHTARKTIAYFISVRFLLRLILPF